jgi:hypothetical protein
MVHGDERRATGDGGASTRRRELRARATARAVEGIRFRGWEHRLVAVYICGQGGARAGMVGWAALAFGVGVGLSGHRACYFCRAGPCRPTCRGVSPGMAWCPVPG